MCGITSSAGTYLSDLICFLLIDALFPLAGTIITLLCYKTTINRIKRIQTFLSWQKDLNIGKLLFYPLTIFIIFLPSLISYFLKMFFHIEIVFWSAATFLITHSLGFINALTYGCQSKVYKQKSRPTLDVSLEFRQKQLDSDLESTDETLRP